MFLGPLAALAAYLYSELLSQYIRLPSRLAESSLDIATYQRAGEGILDGKVPYRDFFIEYPPGSLPFFVPPALFSEGRTGYAVLFASEMALVLVSALVLTALAARASGRFWPLPAAVFAAGAILLSPVAVTRYDSVVALALAVAVAGVTLKRGAPRKLGLALAWLVLGIGGAAKLVPALAAAPLALVHGKKGTVWGASLFSGAVALFFVPAYVLGRQGLMKSFEYHAERGLQLESVASSVLLRLGYVEGVSFEYGSFNISGRGVELWGSLSLPIMASLMLITAAVAVREWRAGNFGPGLFPRYAAAFLLAFMIGSKVLSPQYMIWLLPLLPLAARGLYGLAVSAIFLSACWATTQVFPVHYQELRVGGEIAVEFLLLRNLLLVLLWGLMLSLPTASPTTTLPTGEEASEAQPA